MRARLRRSAGNANELAVVKIRAKLGTKAAAASASWGALAHFVRLLIVKKTRTIVAYLLSMYECMTRLQ